MKQYNFKNFNYEVTNSTRKGIKEIQVTFTADGQSVRHFLFIKEVKEKSDSYYIKKSKEIIASRIKSGELAKTANRQIKGFKLSSGPLKPILITLAAVVGVGAVGTGGYFLSQHLNPTPTPVETGYTVVLNGGDEGYFGTSEQVTYVVIENVKEGTKLSEITGYAEPVSKLYKDFTSWIVTGSDNVKFGKDEAVTASTYLTAVFTDSVQSIREQAKKDILSVYNSIAISLGSDEDSKDILANMDAMLLAADSTTSPLVASDNKEVIKNIGDLTQKALFAVAFAEQPYRQTITQSYASRIKEINGFEPERASALAAISSAYLEALFKVDDPTNPGCLDQMYDFINTALEHGADEKTDKALSLVAPGALEAASLISDDYINPLLRAFRKCVGDILNIIDVHPDDLDTLGDLDNKLFKSISAVIRKVDSMEMLPNAINMIVTIRDRALKQYNSIYEHDSSESTFYHKTLFELNKLAVEKIGDAEVECLFNMPDVYDQAIHSFDQFCHNFNLVSSESTGTVEKVTVFKNICEGEIKAQSRLYDDSGTLSKRIIPDLYKTLGDPELPFNANMISFAYSVLDTAANMPSRDSSQVKSGAGYVALAQITGEFSRRLFDMVKEKYPQESLQCFNVLSAAFLESTKDCSRELLFKGAKALDSYYRKTIEVIFSGAPITNDVKNDCIIVANMITKFSVVLGKYNGIINPTIYNNIIQKNNELFKVIKNEFSDYYNDVKTLFAQELDKGLSNVILNFECYIATDNLEAYSSEVSKIFVNLLEEIIKKTPYEVWANELKLYSLLHQSSEVFAPIIDTSGEEDFSNVIGRCSVIDKTYPHGQESLDKFDAVYDAWKTGLFDKTVRTITAEKFKILANDTRRVVDAILNQA